MSGTLPDGTYDVFVVDAVALDAPATSAGGPAVELTLTVLAGGHKGEVLTVTASGMTGSEIDLLGMPGTLHVRDGVPAVELD